MNPVHLEITRKMIERHYTDLHVAYQLRVRLAEARALIRAVKAQERWGEAAPVYLTDAQILARQGGGRG
jgi:hypothetical protein